MSQRVHPLRRSSGFTLLEIMVVIVIVGIMATVAMISMGALGRDRDMQDQAERIWAVINQAREECELQGFDIGLRVGTTSYDFLRFDSSKQRWLPIVDDNLMGSREFSPGLRVRLWLEGREVVLKEHLGLEDEAKPSEKKVAAADKDDHLNSKETDAAMDAKEQTKEMPPHIMILSSGDVNAFDLQFEREGNDARWHVFLRPDSSVVAEQMLEAT